MTPRHTLAEFVNAGRGGLRDAPPTEAILKYTLMDGVVLVGSDAHVWPGPLTTCQRAFIQFAHTLAPVAVVANGDVFDGSRVSRYPSIGWESRPKVVEELGAVKGFLSQVHAASPNARHWWPAGNHDLRFETRLAQVAPEYEGVEGFHLKDHFPDWTPCWLVELNDVVIKHRWHQGVHATYNNTLKAGRNIVTGHLHRLKVEPFTDYNGTRYGVDTGTLSELYGPQSIHYTEASPVNWSSGFIVLTFRGGRLMYPEMVRKWDSDHVEFRGEIIAV